MFTCSQGAYWLQVMHAAQGAYWLQVMHTVQRAIGAMYRGSCERRGIRFGIGGTRCSWWYEVQLVVRGAAASSAGLGVHSRYVLGLKQRRALGVTKWSCFSFSTHDLSLSIMTVQCECIVLNFCTFAAITGVWGYG